MNAPSDGYLADIAWFIDTGQLVLARALCSLGQEKYRGNIDVQATLLMFRGRIAAHEGKLANAIKYYRVADAMWQRLEDEQEQINQNRHKDNLLYWLLAATILWRYREARQLLRRCLSGETDPARRKAAWLIFFRVWRLYPAWRRFRS